MQECSLLISEENYSRICLFAQQRGPISSIAAHSRFCYSHQNAPFHVIASLFLPVETLSACKRNWQHITVPPAINQTPQYAFQWSVIYFA